MVGATSVEGHRRKQARNHRVEPIGRVLSNFGECGTKIMQLAVSVYQTRRLITNRTELTAFLWTYQLRQNHFAVQLCPYPRGGGDANTQLLPQISSFHQGGKRGSKTGRGGTRKRKEENLRIWSPPTSQSRLRPCWWLSTFGCRDVTGRCAVTWPVVPRAPRRLRPGPWRLREPTNYVNDSLLCFCAIILAKQPAPYCCRPYIL